MSQASLIYSKLYNNSTVGFGAPTQRISVRSSTDKASWGSEPQHREFQYKIPQTRQVGVRGPNTENFSTKFHRQGKLGFGAPTQRISVRNSSDKASWGSRVKYYLFYLFYPTSLLTIFYFTIVQFYNTISVFEQAFIMSNHDTYHLVIFYLFSDHFNNLLSSTSIKTCCWFIC